jgi:arsenate reductase (thioredoxin)
MKKKILFVCLGNICRSPMAEAMARKYGSDVLEVSSAGLTPSIVTTPFTRSVLAEKNIDLGEHMPRPFQELNQKDYDLIVNLSGVPLPRNITVPVEDWNVEDPMGRKEEEFRKTRETIEMLVMRLILRARLGKL